MQVPVCASTVQNFSWLFTFFTFSHVAVLWQNKSKISSFPSFIYTQHPWMTANRKFYKCLLFLFLKKEEEILKYSGLSPVLKNLWPPVCLSMMTFFSVDPLKHSCGLSVMSELLLLYSRTFRVVCKTLLHGLGCVLKVICLSEGQPPAQYEFSLVRACNMQTSELALLNSSFPQLWPSCPQHCHSLLLFPPWFTIEMLLGRLYFHQIRNSFPG